MHNIILCDVHVSELEILPSQQIMEASDQSEGIVFNEYFDKLVVAVQDHVEAIAKESRSKRVINSSALDAILNRLSTPEEKATKLLTSVADSIGHQKDALHKFLQLLEKKQLIASELIISIKSSLKEDTNRRVISQCTGQGTSQRTRKMASSAAMSSQSIMLIQQVVIKNHLADLKSAVQGIIAPLASASQTKRLISKETYRKVMNSKCTGKQKTVCLLSNICNCVRADGKKFEVFLEVLESRRSCKDLVSHIRKDIITMKEGKQPLTESKLTPVSDSHLRQRRGSGATRTPPPPTESTDKPDGSDASKMVHSGILSDLKICTPTVDPQKESEYFRKMDKKQDEALIHDLRRQNHADKKKSKAKQCSLEREITSLKKQVSEKNRQILTLNGERDDFQFALDHLRFKMARLEKEKNRSVELKKKIVELEAKILEIKHEKVDLQCKLDDLNGKFQNLQTSFDETKIEFQSTMKETQSLLKETQSSLKETKVSLSDTTERLQQQDSWLKNLCGPSIVVLILFGIILYKISV